MRFDLLVILACAALTLSHFHSEKLKLSKKWEELIPNLAAELCGVWFSIRFINYMIEKRSKYHTARRWLLNGFYQFMQIARSISLDFNKGQTDFLEQQARLLKDDILPKLKRKLSPDELKLADELASQEEGIILQLREYFNVHRQTSAWWSQVKKISSYPTSTQDLLSTLEHSYEAFLRNYSDGGEQVEIYLLLFDIQSRRPEMSIALNRLFGRRENPVLLLTEKLKELVAKRRSYLASLSSFEKTWQALKINISEETDLLP